MTEQDFIAAGWEIQTPNPVDPSIKVIYKKYEDGRAESMLLTEHPDYTGE